MINTRQICNTIGKTSSIVILLITITPNEINQTHWHANLNIKTFTLIIFVQKVNCNHYNLGFYTSNGRSYLYVFAIHFVDLMNK